MENVKIHKGRVENIVPLEVFDKVYKPEGWEIVKETEKPETIVEELSQKGIVNEKQQNEYIREKQARKKKHFDDGLIKGEE